MEWISVKDKLPELFVDVIVCRRGSAVEPGRRITDWWKVFGTRVKDVTHWMPMPDPPGVARARNAYREALGYCEFKCSLCKKEISVVEGGDGDGGHFSYCPFCGAKLEGEG